MTQTKQPPADPGRFKLLMTGVAESQAKTGHDIYTFYNWDVYNIHDSLAPMDDLGLVKSVDGFGQSVVVAVADAADGRFDPSFKQALAVADREVLHAAIAVVHEAALADRTVIAQRLFECIQHEVCAG